MVKTDDVHVLTDGRLSRWVPQHLLDWRLALHSGWNGYRRVTLCVAYRLLNANKSVHGAYGSASEGELLLVDHDQFLILRIPHNRVALALACRLRACASRNGMLFPARAGGPDTAKARTNNKPQHLGELLPFWVARWLTANIIRLWSGAIQTAKAGGFRIRPVAAMALPSGRPGCGLCKLVSHVCMRILVAPVI